MINEEASVQVASTVKLEKTIGLFTCITMIIGTIIGSGIFVSPTGIIKEVGSLGASLVIWTACGVFSTLGAYCYAELGTMSPRSGGDYYYFLDAFGPFMAFLRLWVEVIVARPATLAVVALTFAKYIMKPIFSDCAEPEIASRLLATACLLFIGFINCYSVRLANAVQDIFTLAKLLALFTIIITGFINIGLGRADIFTDPFDNSNWNFGKLATAFYSGLFAYSGWNYLNCMVEEMKNPKRDLPIGILISCIIVTIVYVMANIAYATTCSIYEILTTPAVAVLFAQRMYGPAWWVLPVCVVLSTFGGINGSVMSTARIFFVAGREQQMPRVLGFLNYKRLTPVPAVVFTILVSIAYLAVDDMYKLMNYLGFVQWLAIGVCVFIVIYLRWKRPSAIRPVKVPIIFAIIYCAVTYFLVIFSFVGSPLEAIMGVVIILTGIPVYIIGCVWKDKPDAFVNFMNSFTLFCQRAFDLVPES